MKSYKSINEIEESDIRSANLHLTGACNRNCRHCIARTLRGMPILTPEGWRPHIEYLKSIGVTKINLAGGEPLLYPYFEEIIDLIASYRITISIVSNGSLIDEEFMKKYQGRIGWIGLSIDSPDEDDEISIGRQSGRINHVNNVLKIAELAKKYGYMIKLNITVVRESWHKDFRPIIETLNADRVKVFRALTVQGANDIIADTWSITDEQFVTFRELHKDCQNIVFEDNDDMIASYLMFSPDGRWMVNDGGVKRFLPFETLVKEGTGSHISSEKYIERGGVYDWEVN